ncbi:MAG: arsenate reductase ArsC [Chloroflexota bacterium]|nr:arsenate reductase ArsC [Chloroflexota bacterium]
MSASPVKVLFLCTGNSCRSQMAEAWLRELGGDDFAVYSAGLEPHGVNPHTITVMEELDFDMSDHRSKSLDEYIGEIDFDFLITVCGNADERCPWFPGMGTRLHWPFEDPAAFEGTEDEKLAFFRKVRDQIKDKIQTWLDDEGHKPDSAD